VAEWRAYHDIRRSVLFEARGQFGVYNEAHPDDRASGHHPRLLLHRGDPVGVIRVDIEGTTAILRRVAVRSDAQRLGHGRVLLSLAQRFAQAEGCSRLLSYVAREAVGFYRKCGFASDHEVGDEPSGDQSVFMTKRIQP
jgi:GNAT superfamily N-acetyltransferase